MAAGAMSTSRSRWSCRKDPIPSSSSSSKTGRRKPTTRAGPWRREMIGTREFLMHARLEAEALDAWIEEGWLLPRRGDDAPGFSEVGPARGQVTSGLYGELALNAQGLADTLGL